MSYNRQDHFYKKAKKEGYRARSSYKLKQIQKKFKIFRRGNIVVDLGAAPGGWSQVVSEYVGHKGKIIAVDKNPIHPFNEENIIILQMDIRSPKLLEYLHNEVGQKANVVISDLAGNTSGQWDLDSERQLYLAKLALDVAINLLTPGGNFVTKVFRGSGIEEFNHGIKPYFEFIKHWRPPATRKQSAEEYIICKNFNNFNEDFEDEDISP